MRNRQISGKPVAMGEAKRRKRLPCICGSGDPAGECCWTSHGYHKKPVVVDLRNTGLTGKHDKCYLAATGACDTKISGEHLISHGVLKILAEKQVELSGLPWQKARRQEDAWASTL